MGNSVIPNDKKQFFCCHCNGQVLVPRDLPPTTAPCPYCGGLITSPGSEEASADVPPVQATPPPVPAPAPAPAEPPVETSSPEPTARPKPIAARETQTTPKSASQAPKSGQFPILLVLLLSILICGIAAYFVSREMRGKITPPSIQTPAAGTTPQETNYLRIGWQKDAAHVLQGFMEATTSEKKLSYIIGGESMAARVEEFYGESLIDDSDTPAASFSVYELSEEDRKRGLFMMTYDQPPQFEMKKFFRPLATLEVQHGLDEADLLLTTLARAANFAMEPLRVHAFFKLTPDGLKLDWEIFAQTKYRTFQHFVELPAPGQSAVFRAFIVEDVPDAGQTAKGSRTYRLSDPANINDAARIIVKEDSEVGKALSVINWRGAKDGRPLTRTATVELSWSSGEDPPQLQISHFICWEFLGLGSEDPKSAASKN